MIGAFILCGGQSSRMGDFKPLVQWNGQALIEYIITQVQGINLPVHLVVKPHQRHLLSNLGLPVIEDVESLTHPLSGVVTALEFAAQKHFQSVLILPCDTPLITSETLGRVMTHCPSVLADHTGVIHPLISHVSCANLASAKRLLILQSSMRAFAESFLRVTVSTEESVNFNHLTDLQRPITF